MKKIAFLLLVLMALGVTACRKCGCEPAPDYMTEMAEIPCELL